MPSETSELEDVDWKDWEAKGKTSFVKNIETILKKDAAAVLDRSGVVSKIPRLVHSLFRECLYGGLSPDNVCETCTAISELDDEIPSVIMDVITIFDTEMDSQKFITSERNKLLRILVLLDEKWCPELSRERIEFETQNEYNKTIKVFHSKFIKIKTRLYYKQNKFNLYREENEGYSKLIMQLKDSKRSSPEEVLENINLLIGGFSLDPTRVVDIILDCFQFSPFDIDFYIPLIKNYMPEKNLLSEVIGFRYLTFRENNVVPRSLHEIVTLMLHYEILTIDDVYPWLSPNDEEIKKETEQNAEDEKSPKKPLPPSLTKEEFEKNQKLSLCHTMISLGSWKTFEMMMNRMPRSYLLEKEQIAEALCEFAHYMISTVYISTGFTEKLVMGKLAFQETPISEKPPQTLDELSENFFPILFIMGPSLRHNIVLVFKLTRIAVFTLSKIFKNENTNCKLFEQITTLITECFFPTLSNVQANSCLSEAIWNVIRLYPLQARYSMYYSWREYMQKNAVLLAKRCQGKVNVKSCMKRVSKENVKQIGRLLGKLSHYSPATLFDYVLFQIQMHDNLIVPVVDALKYMTNMSYDVLGFSIFDSLYNDTKQRPKHDGTTVLPWFQSTVQFCATVFKKYNIDLSGILLYIMEQLKNNRSIELLILKETLQKMTGIDITDDMTQHQIDSLSGGELLRAEAAYFVQQQNFKKTATRLKEALVENNLVAPLGIMLAQQRNYIFFSESKTSHLKFIGKLYDECHDTLLQYGAFINGPIMHDTHSLFPSLHDLLLLYKLDLDAAFHLYRPVIKTLASEVKPEKKKSTKKISNVAESFFEIVDSIGATIEELHPAKQWDDISPKFVALFWSLGLNDISVPVGAYQKEISKQKEQDSQSKPVKDKSTLAEKLTQEMKDQQHFSKLVMEHLKARKNEWFLWNKKKTVKNEMVTQFLHMCVFPRSILSIPDALFCAQIIHILHSIRALNFSTLLCYDRLLCDITFSVMSCTENEASRYGRFLCALLQTIMRWHSTKEIYEKECANTPGFVTKFRASNELSESVENVHYENFRHVCHKWHYKITRSIMGLLESGEYVQIRNGLIVLIKLLPTFPIIGKLATYIEKRINKVKDEEKNNRQDLYTLALSYSGLLAAKSSTWMAESDFHMVSSSSNSTSTSTSNDTNNLNMDTENFTSELSSDIYLSPPSYTQSQSSSPPRSPQQNSHRSSSPKETSPTKDKRENSPPSPKYDSLDDDESVDEKLEEGELNRKAKKAKSTRRKSRIDEKDKEKRKVDKPKARSRSERV